MKFDNKKVYFSGSIKGTPEADPEFAWKLVRFMIDNGANVLSEHVAARSKEEMDKIFFDKVGPLTNEPWVQIRKVDMNWVDTADFVVALVNAPSFGVGMEIERAILKPRLGMSLTPILCLVHKDVLDNNKLSFMIRGVTDSEHPKFYVKAYTNLEEAQKIIEVFLLSSVVNDKVQKGKLNI